MEDETFCKTEGCNCPLKPREDICTRGHSQKREMRVGVLAVPETFAESQPTKR